MDIRKLRKGIREIDNKILQLLSKRFEITKKVGEYKRKSKIKIFQPDVEKEKIKELKKKAKNIDKKFIERLFKSIFAESKRMQRKLK